MKKCELIKLPYFFKKEGPPEKEQLLDCDLFIYQEIRDKNAMGEEFGTDRLMRFLPSKCERIQIPNLYELGYGFFPQNFIFERAPHFINKNNPSFKGDDRGLFVHGDYVIDSMLDRPVNEVVESVYRTDLIDRDKILSMFDKYTEKIREREKRWDIKIADYILSEYKNKQMFNDFGHPSNDVIRKMSRELLEYIGIEDDLKDFKMIYELDEYEDPIYPCVREVLGLKYQKKYLREQSDKKLVEKMTFEEYVREYYFWCQRSDEE